MVGKAGETECEMMCIRLCIIQISSCFVDIVYNDVDPFSQWELHLKLDGKCSERVQFSAKAIAEFIDRYVTLLFADMIQRACQCNGVF